MLELSSPGACIHVVFFKALAGQTSGCEECHPATRAPLGRARDAEFNIACSRAWLD